MSRRRIHVIVQCGAEGGWAVCLPDSERHVICETFEDARRIAFLCAAQGRACELIVRDAYHRVTARERIIGRTPATPVLGPGGRRSRER